MIDNDFFKLIRNRRSVRAFSDRHISSNLLEKIVEAGRIAPSACNKQPWCFYVIRSEEAKQSLRQTYSREWFKTADAYILICSHPDAAWRFLDNSSSSKHIDTTIAGTQMMLAAEALGISSTWVCAFDRQLCAKLFNIDYQLEEPTSILALGYADIDKNGLPFKRKETSEVVKYL